VTLSLFAVYTEELPVGDQTGLTLPGHRLRTYVLDDEDRVLGGRTVVEYDVHLSSLPLNLGGCLSMLLAWAHSSGAVVAWFGFEGSFHFDHLLTGDIANQVYALVDAEGVALADSQDLTSAFWRARVERAGVRACYAGWDGRVDMLREER
jgi:hypothetical protein